GGSVLRLPSVLYRQAEDRRHRRSRRALPSEIRQRPAPRLSTARRSQKKGQPGCPFSFAYRIGVANAARIGPSPINPDRPFPMHDRSQPRSSPERHIYGAAGLTLLVLAYMLPGAIGHEPWRGDDIEHFATTHALLRGEWWLLPTLAGEPVAGHGPFHYWLSALFAALFGWLPPLHAATRRATPSAAALATLWITRSASRLYGRKTRAAAALLTIGTLGLAVHVHEHQPMVTLMALQAMTLAGLALIP